MEGSSSIIEVVASNGSNNASRLNHRRTICATTTSSSSLSSSFSASNNNNNSTSPTTSLSSNGSFKLPSLNDILSNMAPEPYSLKNFSVFVKQNHCLEILEFIKSVDVYGQYFNNNSNHLLKQQWDYILNTFIRVNSPMEINLPCNIRDDLLTKLWNQHQPLLPSCFNNAVDLVKDLMKENVYLPFISSAKHFNEQQQQQQQQHKKRTYSIHNHSDGSISSQQLDDDKNNNTPTYRLTSSPPPNDNYITNTNQTPPPKQQPNVMTNRNKPNKLWKNGFKWLKKNHANDL